MANRQNLAFCLLDSCKKKDIDIIHWILDFQNAEKMIVSPSLCYKKGTKVMASEPIRTQTHFSFKENYGGYKTDQMDHMEHISGFILFFYYPLVSKICNVTNILGLN